MSAGRVLRAALAAGALASTAVGAPFTAGNLLAVRFGDGATALSTTAVAGAVVEVNPSTGAVVQTLNLPTAFSGTDAPCSFYGSANQEGLGTLSADSR